MWRSAESKGVAHHIWADMADRKMYKFLIWWIPIRACTEHVKNLSIPNLKIPRIVSRMFVKCSMTRMWMSFPSPLPITGTVSCRSGPVRQAKMFMWKNHSVTTCLRENNWWKQLKSMVELFSTAPKTDRLASGPIWRMKLHLEKMGNLRSPSALVTSVENRLGSKR